MPDCRRADSANKGRLMSGSPAFTGETIFTLAESARKIILMGGNQKELVTSLKGQF